jgi:hypothetical protein
LIRPYLKILLKRETINNSNIQITPLALKYAKNNNINLDGISPQMRRIHISDLTQPLVRGY